jgi:hypothetical protein
MVYSSPISFILIYDSIIALTQHITALFITVYLLRLPEKARFTWWFIAFFLGVSVVTAAIFLEASILAWGHLFFALRVVAGLCAQASLIQFAYHFPSNDQPREARGLLWMFLGLILLAVGASMHYIVHSLAAPAQALPMSRAVLTVLLPIGVLSVIGVLLRRVLHLHYAAQHAATQPRRFWPDLGRALKNPASLHAATVRTFGAMLLFGLIPAVAPLLRGAEYLSAPVTAYIIGLGILLVHLALFLVFLNHVRIPSSFVTRIFSIALVLLLTLFGVVALLTTSARNAQFRQTRQWQIATVQQALPNDILTTVPESVAYIAAVSPPSSPGEETGTRLLYPQPSSVGDAVPLNAQFITAEDQLRRSDGMNIGHVGVRTMDYVRELTTIPHTSSVLRYADHPVGTIPRYVAYQVQTGG